VKNGPHGTPDRAVGIMMDDTEAYESARALVDVNAQLKLAVDLGQIAIWRHDLRTQRMHYSDRAFQTPAAGAAARGLLDRGSALVHPSGRPARWCSPRPERRSPPTSRPTWRRAIGASTAATAT
jgi:hypothetical protein